MRVGQIAMVLALGLFMILAATNNVLTLGDNKFSANSSVAFAVGMQETGQHPKLMWRSIDSPAIIGIAVAVIILTETVAGVLCLWGCYGMWSARKADVAGYAASKTRAMQGLTVIAVFYMLAFQTIAGEWFMIWQTPAPTMHAAFMLVVMSMLVLFWVRMVDD